MMMVTKGLIKQHLHQVLDSLGGVFVILLFLKIVFLKVLYHLLASLTELRVELYHWHVFHNQVIGTTVSVFFAALTALLVLINNSRDHSHLFGFLIHLELLP